MRKLPLVLAPLLFGCDSDTATTTVSLDLRAHMVEGDKVCFALRVTNQVGATLFDLGDHTSSPATLEAAEASGATCIETASVVKTRCSPGPSTATAWVVGFFSAGLRTDDTYVDPCGADGCELAFECIEGEDTAAVFDFSIVRDANQGFFDIAVFGKTAPAGATGVCYSVRVSNGQGVTVLRYQNLCSTDYGNGTGADISYISPCDAEHANNTVAIWVHPPEGATAPYNTPCPAPTSGSIDDWTGGCVRNATCLEDQDTVVEFDLETEAR